jgi:hypothetical protein
MKHLKIIGLAAIAVLGLMAFVGAGTASATTLFTSSNLTGAYTSGTEFHAELSAGKTDVLTDGSGNPLVTCTGSTVAGKTSNTTGTQVFIALLQIFTSGCDTTVDVLANGSLEIEKTSKANEGKVVGKNTQVTVTIFGVSCVYGTGTGTTLGTITGGTAPMLNIAAVGLTKVSGGFLCPSSAGWDANFTVGTPHAGYIGA